MIQKYITSFVAFTVCAFVGVGDSQARTSNSTQPLSEERVIHSGDLAGIYVNAGEDSPVILIVPGSGPTDLNGNNTLGVNSNVYRLLSEALAKHGISSVRVDKRGMFSSQAAGEPNKVSVEIYAQDYRSWTETILEETKKSCVYLLGHSEGSLMVSAAAIENNNVCGLILVAGAGRPMGDILREQLKANPANRPLLKQAFKAIESLERGERVDENKLHKALRPLFYSDVQDFLISVVAVDPAKVAADAKKSTLIIHGVNDLQTSVIDAQKLADATGGYLVLIEGVNHILKEAPADRRRNLATCQKPNLPISDSVVEAIRIFVNE